MINSNTIAQGLLKAAGAICAIVLLLLFLLKIKTIIAYCAIATVVALIGRPIVLFMRRRLQFNNTFAVILTLLSILSLLVGIFALFVPVISDQSNNLALLSIESLQDKLNEFYTTLSQQFGTSQEVLAEIIDETDIQKNVAEGLNSGFAANFLKATVGTLGTIGIGVSSVLFISFFLLKDSHLIQRVILAFVPAKHAMKTVQAISDSKNLLSRYFAGLVIQMIVLFLLYAAGLLIAGIENALIIAMVCALLNIIPYVGPMISIVLMILLTVTSNLDMDFNTVILPKTVYVLIGFTVAQLVDNFLSQPLIFSNSVKSHPLEIFLVIIIAGILFGIPGMIAGVPSYTVIKVVLKEFGAQNRLVEALTKDM